MQCRAERGAVALATWLGRNKDMRKPRHPAGGTTGLSAEAAHRRLLDLWVLGAVPGDAFRQQVEGRAEGPYLELMVNVRCDPQQATTAGWEPPRE
ncbi:hypothetical protein NDU88_002636 [Pleurodeles waltl]|uniref:Uncharacterized protein n=1 Tax=Pleurodeles waltl TaxID=8319 RepID=A0AAV7LG82_PLEWA|nr:hypothetical protein NDU88_002636 [Pleurodeles waltl]